MKIIRYGLSFMLLLALLIGVVAMLQIVLPYLSFRYDIGFLLTKQAVLHIKPWRYAFYIHIFSSIFVLASGLSQFIKPVLTLAPKVHRSFGKVYVMLVLFLSAPSGLIMAFYANGGIPAKLSFVIVSLLWWVFTFLAYKAIRRGNIERHIHFMTRSYALTLSAITLRLYVYILPGFTSLHGADMYILVSWLSWVPNLLLAEMLNLKRVFYFKKEV